MKFGLQRSLVPWTRRERVVAWVFAIGCSLVLLLGVIRGESDPPADKPYSLKVQLIGGGPTTSVRVDPISDQLRVQDGNLGPDDYVVSSTRVAVPAALVPAAAELGYEWVAVPRDVLPALDGMTTANVRAVLVHDVKSCELVDSPETIQMVSVLVAQPKPDQVFQACGQGILGGGFTDGASVSASHEFDVSPESWFPPDSEVWIVTQGDSEYDEVLTTVADLFETG